MKPFLHLPVPHDLYRISEGWVYSDEEFAIHGHREHLAVDYACPRLTPIFAAADGWAMGSYDNVPPVDATTGQTRTYMGKPIGFGRGFFVQIYHSDHDAFTRYYHLERIAESVPFYEPRSANSSYTAANDRLAGGAYVNSGIAIRVSQGAVVGYVGDSGLEWGYSGYPTRPDPARFPSWDETHLHLKVFARNEAGTDTPIDPYDIRGPLQDYPWPTHVRPMGPAHLWQVVREGLPR